MELNSCNWMKIHQKEWQRSNQLDFAGNLEPEWLHHYKFNDGVYQGL